MKMSAVHYPAVIVLWIWGFNVCQAADRSEYTFENQTVSIKVMPRSADQMVAFYEGRGFPQKAHEAIRKACFMTVIVYNKTKDRLWLDLNQWQFSSITKLQRLDRKYWQNTWDYIDLQQSSRSTFGWTLLPETRDLYPEEGVGGNITITSVREPFEIDATFLSGKDKQGTKHKIRLGKLLCKFD